MSAIAKVLAKAKGNPALIVGSIILILVAVAVIVTIIGSILIFGLVISCLRSIGGSSSK